MSVMPPRMQVAKSLSENASLVTSPPFYIGDLRDVTVSLSTQSTHATNIQLSNADGFQSAIPENSWFNVLTPSVNSLFVVSQSGARWSRSSSPAASNATIIFAGTPGV